jgi:hypothetical protein
MYPNASVALDAELARLRARAAREFAFRRGESLRALHAAGYRLGECRPGPHAETTERLWDEVERKAGAKPAWARSMFIPSI